MMTSKEFSIGMILVIILITAILTVGMAIKKFKERQLLKNKTEQVIVQDCTFISGTIIAKRQYCTIDCRYTLVIEYDNKATEVNVSHDKYKFKMVGEGIDILINCK